MVYTISLIFFISTLTPLIQNTAIAILQARNQQKYRSLMMVIVGAVSLVAQFILAKYYGAVGCAIAVAGANIIGQGIILNWYYLKIQRLDIITFWKEIIRMSVFPIMFSIIGYIITSKINIQSWGNLIICVLLITVLYIPLFWKLSLNKYEKNLLTKPLNKIRTLILH